MKLLNLTAISALALLVLASCNNKNNRDARYQEKDIIAFTPGMYTGTLPCDTCSGILTYLTFDTDSTVTLAAIYDDDYGTVIIDYGTWRQQDSILTTNLSKSRRNFIVKSDSEIATRTSRDTDSRTLKREKSYVAAYFNGTFIDDRANNDSQTLMIRALSDTEAQVDISSSRGADKGCAFSGKGKVVNNQILVPMKDVSPSLTSTMIIRPDGDNEMVVSAGEWRYRNELNTFCKDNGTLAGHYKRAD